MIFLPLRELRRSDVSPDLPPVASHRYWGIMAEQMMAVFRILRPQKGGIMWTKCGFWSFRPQKGQVLWTKCRFRAFPERALQEIVSWKGFRDWKNVSSNLGRSLRAACGCASVIGNSDYSNPEAKPFPAKIEDHQRVSIRNRGDGHRRCLQETLTGYAHRSCNSPGKVQIHNLLITNAL